MELEITPEPPPEEHDAILAALRRLVAEERSDGSRPAWWRAGLPDEEDDLAGKPLAGEHSC